MGREADFCRTHCPEALLPQRLTYLLNRQSQRFFHKGNTDYRRLAVQSEKVRG